MTRRTVWGVPCDCAPRIEAQRVALIFASSTMQRQMLSDDELALPFNEDMADAIIRCEKALHD